MIGSKIYAKMKNSLIPEKKETNQIDFKYPSIKFWYELAEKNEYKIMKRIWDTYDECREKRLKGATIFLESNGDVTVYKPDMPNRTTWEKALEEWEIAKIDYDESWDDLYVNGYDFAETKYQEFKEDILIDRRISEEEYQRLHDDIPFEADDSMYYDPCDKNAEVVFDKNNLCKEEYEGMIYKKSAEDMPQCLDCDLYEYLGDMCCDKCEYKNERHSI